MHKFVLLCGWFVIKYFIITVLLKNFLTCAISGIKLIIPEKLRKRVHGFLTKE